MKSSFSEQNLFLNLAFSTATVIFSSAILVLLRPYLSISVVALLYLIPVVVSAARFGKVAGIAASILSFLVFNYFFISPYYTFRVAHPQDFLAMIVLLGVAIFISSLVARVQANLVQVQAREWEANLLYELSIDLAGKSDQAVIAKTLAHRLAMLFQASAIEVEIQSLKTVFREYGINGINLNPPNQAQPQMTIQLSSPRGLLGEIRIWNVPGPLTPGEERLLKTFASQGVLALDRAILSDSETRAHILEESDRLKTAILSSVSHELRTPLASIQASATSLFNSKFALEPEARAELQSLLLEETDNLTQLVGNLLNMSRIEAGALKLQRQWDSLADVVDTGLKRLQRSLSGHLIEVDVSEDLPLVSIDSVLMEQVVINLVRNSLKFAPAHTPVRIQARVDEQNLWVTISNSGPHIPEEFIDHVFEKFYPIPGKDTLHGTGLGLSICKGIVEAHGGQISAANPPVGVEFRFNLPLLWDGVMPMIPNKELEAI